MRSVYFDVDGTVVNSRPLVRQAYEAIGVKMPSYAWGLRWQDWLIDYCEGAEDLAKLLHRQKTNEYTKILLRCDIMQYELPAARLARRLLITYGTTGVRYLTAGTPETAYSIVDRLFISAPLTGGLTYDARREVLAQTPDGTVYFDDNENTIARLTVDVPHLNPVHVNGQSFEELLITMRELT